MTTNPVTQEAKLDNSRQRGRLRQIPKKILIAPIRFYQLAISPYRHRTCRYYPSCSQYALTALQRHGVFKGLSLGAWRILRCNPWTPGGVDHVPDEDAAR